MGPLFSLLIASIAGLFVASVAFCVLRFWHSAGHSLILAGALVAGAGLGFVAAIVAAVPIVGVGGTLESGAAVMGYLAWLGVGSMVCGLVAVIGVARVLAKWARASSAL